MLKPCHNVMNCVPNTQRNIVHLFFLTIPSDRTMSLYRSYFLTCRTYESIGASTIIVSSKLLDALGPLCSCKVITKDQDVRHKQVQIYPNCK
jgi:hypothetical protein